MELVSIEAASKSMGIPIEWTVAMIEKEEIDAVDTLNGPMINAAEIEANGWNTQRNQDVVSYGHVNELMVTLGLRVLH